MIFCHGATALAALVLLAGCQKPDASAPPAAASGTNVASTIPGWPPTHAQPKLPALKLFIGAETVTAEVALTPVQVGTGMMFRQGMAEDEGMIFVFDRPQRTSFYMRNTTLPLTAAYLDSEGTILELHDLKPLDETPVPAASDNVQFVLEMNQGWFKRHNVNVGVVVATETGRLRGAFRFAH